MEKRKSTFSITQLATLPTSTTYELAMHQDWERKNCLSSDSVATAPLHNKSGIALENSVNVFCKQGENEHQTAGNKT